MKNYKSMNKATADKIRDLYFNQGIKQTLLAKRFSMSQPAVSRIVSEHVW